MVYTTTIHVIIPVYKAEKYISQAIDSVLGQPYSNIEIVCVDDGSPDDSISILRDYERRCKNIHVIQQSNGGVSSARNTGIEYVLSRCKDHDYMVFLDSDDLWVRNAITPEAVSRWYGMDCVGYTSVRCTNDLSKVTPESEITEAILRGGKSSVWCHKGHPMGAMFYACRLIRRYGIRFIDGLKYAEDGLFKFACLYLADQIYLVNQALYLYRTNTRSAMHSRSFGIAYMAPIVRGYLQTGNFLKWYENETRETAAFCNVLAGVYVIELAAEHYQQMGSRRELEKFLQEEPDFVNAVAMLNSDNLSDNHRRMYDLYIGAPARFRCLNRVKGIKKYVLRSILSNRYVLRWLENWKYTNRNTYL